MPEYESLLQVALVFSCCVTNYLKISDLQHSCVSSQFYMSEVWHRIAGFSAQSWNQGAPRLSSCLAALRKIPLFQVHPGCWQNSGSVVVGLRYYILSGCQLLGSEVLLAPRCCPRVLSISLLQPQGSKCKSNSSPDSNLYDFLFCDQSEKTLLLKDFLI